MKIGFLWKRGNIEKENSFLFSTVAAEAELQGLDLYKLVKIYERVTNPGRKKKQKQTIQIKARQHSKTFTMKMKLTPDQQRLFLSLPENEWIDHFEAEKLPAYTRSKILTLINKQLVEWDTGSNPPRYRRKSINEIMTGQKQ